MNTAWLRVIYNGSVNNIFYNDNSAGYGWLRAYYKDDNNNVILVGTNLTLEDNVGEARRYSGIIRVRLAADGTQTAVEALYDDNNMYSDTYATIGSQLNWGYWDPSEMAQAKFFAQSSGSTALPLSLGTGVSEEGIRDFIRNKFHTISLDTLDSLTFEGRTTSESWTITIWLDDLVSDNISGETWSQWRQDNGLTNVQFGNAKQLLFAESGELYAVMSLDTWGSSAIKGDKLFMIIDASGEANIVAYPQDTATNYKSMNKVRLYGDYAIYSSSKVGRYKLFRLDLTDSSQLPVDLIPDKTNVEIYGFNFNPLTGMLMYNVYDNNTNSSYLAEQLITSTDVASESSAEGRIIIDVEPFIGPDSTTTSTTVTTTTSTTTTLDSSTITISTTTTT